MDKGAAIEAKNRHSCRPLHWAVINGHVAVVIELLSRGANTAAKECIGDAHLHLAAKNDHLAVVIELLSHGPSIDTNHESKGETTSILGKRKSR
jgi:ankyrin repeat protein